MPRAKAKKQAPEPDIVMERTQISSVMFGLVMVVALIVAGAALLGGSLSQVGKRWGSAMDGASRTVGLSVDNVEVIGLEHVPAVARQIRTAAMIEPGENMFRADPHLIRRRVAVFERVMPLKIAGNIRRFSSAFIMSDYQDGLRMEEEGLRLALSVVDGVDDELFESLRVVTSFQCWRGLRLDQGLSVEDAAAVMRRLVKALTKDL